MPSSRRHRPCPWNVELISELGDQCRDVLIGVGGPVDSEVRSLEDRKDGVVGEPSAVAPLDVLDFRADRDTAPPIDSNQAASSPSSSPDWPLVTRCHPVPTMS